MFYQTIRTCELSIIVCLFCLYDELACINGLIGSLFLTDINFLNVFSDVYVERRQTLCKLVLSVDLRLP